MKITSYLYSDTENRRWEFDEVKFRRINLLVGNSGTGKTRFLNTIFNLGANIAQSEIQRTGYWKVTLEHQREVYQLELKVEKSATGLSVTKEQLWHLVNNEPKIIVDRDANSFLFMQDELPRLSQSSTAVHLFKDEDLIKPIYRGFATILRRDFAADALEETTKYDLLIRDVRTINEISDLFIGNLQINSKLRVMKSKFPEIYNKVIEDFKEIFPFIQSIRFKKLDDINQNITTFGNLEVFAVKENFVREWIPINDLSSGMKKVLLLLTDIYTLPEGGIYLIDEYENSLGVNAINFLPELLMKINNDMQLIITSHHPYIINNIPVKNWLVFHRDGSHVSIRYGDMNVAKYGHSRQDSFIQLINDPFFEEGIK